MRLFYPINIILFSRGRRARSVIIIPENEISDSLILAFDSCLTENYLSVNIFRSRRFPGNFLCPSLLR